MDKHNFKHFLIEGYKEDFEVRSRIMEIYNKMKRYCTENYLKKVEFGKRLSVTDITERILIQSPSGGANIVIAFPFSFFGVLEKDFEKIVPQYKDHEKFICFGFAPDVGNYYNSTKPVEDYYEDNATDVLYGGAFGAVYKREKKIIIGFNIIDKKMITGDTISKIGEEALRADPDVVFSTKSFWRKFLNSKMIKEAFIHELIHIVDDSRIPGGLSSGSNYNKTADYGVNYYNSPVEINARFHQALTAFEDVFDIKDGMFTDVDSFQSFMVRIVNIDPRKLDAPEKVLRIVQNKQEANRIITKIINNILSGEYRSANEGSSLGEFFEKYITKENKVKYMKRLYQYLLNGIVSNLPEELERYQTHIINTFGKSIKEF